MNDSHKQGMQAPLYDMLALKKRIAALEKGGAE